MSRPSWLAPTSYWIGACFAIILSGFFTQLLAGLRWTLPLGYAFGSAYPALLVAGALVYARRNVPGWLLPGALAFGFARGLLGVAGNPGLAHGAALIVEPAAVLAAAWLVRGAVGGSDASFPQRALAPALVAMAVIEAASSALALPGPALPRELIGAWVLGGALLLALQVAAWGEQMRAALRRSRDELEQRVAEETERYRIVSELSSDFSFALDMDSNYRVRGGWGTDALPRITGYHAREMRTLDWRTVIPAEDQPGIVEQIDRVVSGKLHVMEFRIITKSGDERWLNVRFGGRRRDPDGSFHILGAARDITERMNAEQERSRLDQRMRDMQRLESLGLLAGGIAHDFNNVLTVILGNSRLALADFERGALSPDRLRRIRSAAEYARGLTEQILASSGKAAVKLEPLDLSWLAEDMVDLVRESLEGNATLEKELPRDLPAVEGDATQLRQVIFNLVTNATEALGGAAGTVTLRTGVRDVSASEIAETSGASEAALGPYVYVEVSDTGEGFGADTRARIFDPFYTTKASGRGLGLAAVLGIVRAHGGMIRVDSEPGRGTSFQVLLPRSSRTARSEAPRPLQDPCVEGGGTVLVVDDE